MSRANGLRAIPWMLGIVLVIISVAGANRLLTPDSAGKGGAAPANPTLPGGVLVIGVADSDPPPVQVGPPAIAAMATVKKVLVREGQEVKAGDPLVQFDDDIPNAKLAEAKAELLAAQEDVKLADLAGKDHAIDLQRQQSAVNATARQVKLAEDGLRVGREQYEAVLRAEKDFTTGAPLTEAQKQKRREENQELRTAEAQVNTLKSKAADEQLLLQKLELGAAKYQSTQQQAKSKVIRLEATVQEAQAAVDACLVKVRELAGGIVEQVTVTPGATYGPSTRGPLMWLVPTGGRVVRAEVEAEFASKIADKIGKKVTVYDHSNFAVTYEGVVKRIGTAFLPKRSSGEAIAMTSTRTLECLIEVPDPSPAGRPPLRVGQPVRVSFPQN